MKHYNSKQIGRVRNRIESSIVRAHTTSLWASSIVVDIKTARYIVEMLAQAEHTERGHEPTENEIDNS